MIYMVNSKMYSILGLNTFRCLIAHWRGSQNKVIKHFMTENKSVQTTQLSISRQFLAKGERYKCFLQDYNCEFCVKFKVVFFSFPFKTVSPACTQELACPAVHVRVHEQIQTELVLWINVAFPDKFQIKSLAGWQLKFKQSSRALSHAATVG